MPIKALEPPPAPPAGKRGPVWLVLDEVAPARSRSSAGSRGPQRRGRCARTLSTLCVQVMDPQNLGALLRSASFLGCAGVVVCAKNSAGLTPTVSKASAGAMEALEVSSRRRSGRTSRGPRGTAAPAPRSPRDSAPRPPLVLIGHAASFTPC